ncbi:MAG TPA: membrane protein insertase YidC [Burkholderiales bacterium]|nr:membrane protein insertase YidC [Burkholderiales bacterium]
MDSFRIFAGVVFAVSVFFLVEAWTRDHQKGPPQAPPRAAQQQGDTAPPIPTTALGQGATPAAVRPADVKPTKGERIRVATDVMLAEIDTVGGDLRRVELVRFRDTFDRNQSLVLLQDNEQNVYVAQSGLIGDKLPNHTSQFKSAQASYELAPGADAVTVRLTAAAEGGAQLEKTYVFHRGSYAVDVSFRVTNTGTTAIAPFAYFQLVRDTKPPPGDSKMVPVFNGIEIYTEKDKLSKASFDDILKNKLTYPKSAPDGWIAVVQHYFLASWLPKPGELREYFVRNLDNGMFAAGVILGAGRIEPGKSNEVSSRLYVGPQEQGLLKTLAPGLELTVDYGWLRPLAVPLFWVLNEIHSVVNNWGVAIILLTVIIKLIFYPLSAASYKSMAKMKVLAPKLQRLKERFGDDRQRMHQAMMELYKTEKINPLGGCLPIVVQIPVFIALYWVLLLSVELRQAPFILWIQDLSRPDPFFILPILMGATMFIQTWLNPTPPDPMQAKLMKIMPIAFSVFFFFFPSGLVLYWLVNNILSIAQQWRITHVLERAKTAHGGS